MRGRSMHEALERKVPLVLLDAALSHVRQSKGFRNEWWAITMVNSCLSLAPTPSCNHSPPTPGGHVGLELMVREAMPMHDKRERLWAPREGLEPKWPRMYPSQTGSDALLTSWTYARPPSVTSIISPQSSFGPGRIRKTPFSFPFDSRSLYACDGEMSSLGGMNQTPYPQTTHLPPSMHTLPGRTNRATPGRHAPDHQHLIQVMAVRERLLLPYL